MKLSLENNDVSVVGEKHLNGVCFNVIIFLYGNKKKNQVLKEGLKIRIKNIHKKTCFQFLNVIFSMLIQLSYWLYTSNLWLKVRYKNIFK